MVRFEFGDDLGLAVLRLLLVCLLGKLRSTIIRGYVSNCAGQEVSFISR
jgi:hypothetical protein